jgi:hypothetical protein
MPQSNDNRRHRVPPQRAAAPAFLPTCRARALLGVTDFAECLTEHPFDCPHRLCFGYSSFCRHPQHREIVARTSQAG